MFLQELVQDSLLPKIIAVSDQLKADFDNGKISKDLTLDQLLQHYQNYDIILDKTDLYDMIKKPPLNKIISNIQGDKVIFKGTELPEVPTDRNQDIVKNMAKNAAKNLK